MAAPARLSRMTIGRILLATDFSPESESALQYAIALSRRYDSCLFLAHVADSSGAESSEAKRHDAEARMLRLEMSHDLSSLSHTTIVRMGEAWQVVKEIAGGENIDLIIVGTGAGGISKLFLGSTAEQVIRHADCPVLTVGPCARALPLGRLGYIVYATDFSAGSMRALNCALSLAEKDRAGLTMLHIVESMPVLESQQAEWKRQDRARLAGMVPPDFDLAGKPELEVVVGTPAEEIVRLADTRSAELIVMGSHAAGAVATHVPWTTLHYVLQHAHCPVLTVRGVA